MDFQLDKVQLMTRNSMREFVRKELLPIGRELDDQAEFPMLQYRKMVDLGVLDMTLTETMGGSGTDFLSFIIALEEFAYGNAGMAYLVAQTELASYLLSRYGSVLLQDTYISRLVNAETIGTVALHCPDTAGDMANWPFQATSRDNTYILSGNARCLAAAPLADMALVFGLTGEQQLSVFALDTSTTGVTIGDPTAMMGLRTLPMGDLTLNNAPVPADARLGDEGAGKNLLNDALNRLRTAAAAVAVGLTQAAFDEAASYSKQRTQFGQAVAKFEATRNKVADIATGIAAARLLVYNAACAIDQGVNPEKQSAMANLFASDLAVAACREAVQIHGGYGYVKDYPVERLYRDAIFTQIYLETNDSRRLRIADQVLSRIK